MLETPEVLIVGAGPTGLMLANQLARHGVRATIIDRNPGPSVQTKALAVQSRTLEIYSRMGIAEPALQLGQRATGANLWVEGRPMARVPLGDIGRDLSPFPFVLILGQDDNEKLLGAALRRHGIVVQWNTELVGLEQNADGVRATLKQSDGSTRRIETRWLAGCDGPHSAVRNLCGIGFPGAPYAHVFFVADTRMTGPMIPDELNVYLWRSGFHLFFPLHGTDHWRVVGILPPELRDRDDLDFETVAPAVRKEAGTALQFQTCSWFSTYRIHHRRAEKFRDRRCFLLGDAAHIHSPVGGQGMNTGLQDAYNLGWKLARVVTRQADERLLDSFEAERIPVAERLLETTDRAFALIVSDSGLAGLLRTRVLARVLAFAMRFERIQKLAYRTIAQIGIQYRSSPLSEPQSGLPPDAPRAGDRFPWLRLRFTPGGITEDLYSRYDDTRFNLLLFGQPAPASVDQRILVHCIPDDVANELERVRRHIPKPSFFLLRPDGHVGLAGRTPSASALSHYLHERLGDCMTPL
ncbi:MAG: FAD-dependent monooxygenase [Pseudomonadota bacterium]